MQKKREGLYIIPSTVHFDVLWTTKAHFVLENKAIGSPFRQGTPKGPPSEQELWTRQANTETTVKALAAIMDVERRRRRE